MASLVEAFQAMGYELCATRDVESGYQKVALYGLDDAWRHAAKQLADGRWSSKCGFLDDIAHELLMPLFFR
jgi:hypothetical protein